MFRVVDLDEADFWRSCWEKLPIEQRSVYLLPEYYSIYQNIGHGHAYCFIYQYQEALLIYPFLKKNIDILKSENVGNTYFDAQGAYGLNGAGFFSMNDTDIKNISSFWKKYCNDEKIIAEFTRLNPHISSHVLEYLDTFLASKVVEVDLLIKDLLYESYEHSVRKAIKKAIKYEIKVNSYSSAEMTDDLLIEFINIYEATMDRRSAGDFYYFGFDYFKLIKNFLPSNARWFFASVNNNVISVELVLFDECVCYSFLGGTLPDFFSHGTNVLLKHEIILFFQKKGLLRYFLGGGSTPDDGIFRYKRSFSKSEPRDFYLGKKVHDVDIYNEAIGAWDYLNPNKKDIYKNFFLKYRC